MISMRTEIGARFPAHCTAVGKAVLAYLPNEEIDAIVRTNGLPRNTFDILLENRSFFKLGDDKVGRGPDEFVQETRIVKARLDCDIKLRREKNCT